MEIKVKGEMTIVEIRQAIFEKLQELEEDCAVRYSHGATLYINPTNGFGDRIEPHKNGLPMLAQLFGISVDELVGLKGAAAKRGPAPKLQRQIEQVALLPKTKQRFVSEMLDTVIQQAASH